MNDAKYTDDSPIYSTRILKSYLNYIRDEHPDIEISDILAYARISELSIKDQAGWLTQRQMDGFQKIIVEKTGNPNISRDSGRRGVASGAFGAAQHYTMGLLDLSYIFQLIGKLNTMVSRGAVMQAVKLGPNKVEIVSTPAAGVNEKPYQCESRKGVFESLAMFVTERPARIEHPECFHKGQGRCRYIVSWEGAPSLTMKRIRNLAGLMLPMAALAAFPVLDRITWAIGVFIGALGFCALWLGALIMEKKELSRIIENQGDSAKELLNEMDNRLSNSLLVQEVGQALSHILDIDELVATVVNIMARRMHFNRGLVMLADKTRSRLIYSAGYGYNGDQEDLLRKTAFHIDNPDSEGPFVQAYQKQKPFFINDMSTIKDRLTRKSLEVTLRLGVRSMICVPILFEKESLGILAVDNVKSEQELTESDGHLLAGVASQTAVGIVNALSIQRVQDSEKRYRELVENVNSIIMRMDGEGNISFFNEFACNLFGYDRDAIIGKNIRTTILAGSEESGYRFQSLLGGIASEPDGRIVCQTEHVLKSGGRAWITWTCKLICDAEETFNEILCVGSDTTELKLSEKEKDDLGRKLQRAQKMEALGTLAGGVAHDLNNILSGIVSYPELLLMELAEDSPLRKPILTIQKSGERAAAIVQDLLTLARRGVETAKVANLNDVVSIYLKSPEYEKLRFNNPGVNVRTNLTPGLLNMFGSTVHLSKVLMNLVSNAAEAMPDGGEVVIETRNRYIDRAINGYDNVEEGDYVTLTVTDSGVGIPDEDMDRIFEPFYTKKVMGMSGTGLGLAIVWGTVKDHNGYIDLKSREGEGTRFKLYFPVTRQLPDREPGQVSLNDLLGEGESILVVDDMVDQRDIASQMLKKLNYRVSAVPSGEAAVDYVRIHPVDLLVLDMIMDPGMDGLETYREIVRIKPGTRAIIASGFSETDKVRRVQDLGAGAYVKKPYTLRNLGAAIRTELDRAR